MKVLYNITPLGIMHFKSGCFRVTESLAEQLALRNDIELKFYSNSILASYKALEYVQKSGNLSIRHFSVPHLSGTTKKIVGFHSGLSDVIHKKEMNSIKRVALKSERKLFKLLSQKIYNVNGEEMFMDVADLKTASVHHSTYEPLPRRIAEKYKIPSFFTSYDMIPVLFPEWCGAFTGYFKSLLDSLTRDTWILCISECSRNDLLNYMGEKIDSKKVFVTTLAAADFFYRTTDEAKIKNVREKYNIPDAPYILSLCTFDARKNIDAVIRSFAEMIRQEHINDLHLVLVGEASAMPKGVASEIERTSELKDRIILTGSVPDEDLAPLYSDALMFVYPTLYEGSGLPPLEAMQCGTPVITSNNSSLPEVVGDAAVMIQPRDVEALSQAVLSLYRDSALREELASKSVERAKLFSWKKCADQTVAAYKHALG